MLNNILLLKGCDSKLKVEYKGLHRMLLLKWCYKVSNSVVDYDDATEAASVRVEAIIDFDENANPAAILR